MKKLLCVICCMAAMCLNGINVSAGSNDTTEAVDYMNTVKGLITTSPDASVFTQKSGVKYGEVKSLTYYSQTAERNTPVNIILPPDYTSDKTYPVLYILHGFTDTQDWMLRSDVALVNMLGNLISSGEAEEMIVVLPYIFCSKEKVTCTGGINKENSDCYDNFINDLKTDLMDFIEQNFPVAPGRENTAITGFSMGGQGVLVYAANHPELFKGAAILGVSPINTHLPPEEIFPNPSGCKAIKAAARGEYEEYLASYANVWDRLAELAKNADAPDMLFGIGTRDVGYEGWLKFREYCENIGLKATYESLEGHYHDWNFCELYIQRTLKFFGLA